QVRRMVRTDLSRSDLSRTAAADPSQPQTISWDPENGLVDEEALAEVDAVVHLAGEPLADRFTEEHKQQVLQSRVQATTAVADALARLERRDAAGRSLISGSAIGWYGATA